MVRKYTYFTGKSATVIRKLCTGEGNAKNRLLECENDISIMLRAPVPPNLLKVKQKIKDFFDINGHVVIKGKSAVSFRKALYRKNNATASNIIKDIYSLHCSVREYTE